MSGDLFELLFVIAFILFGILGGRRKKPGAGQPQRPVPRPRPRPAPRPEQRSAGGRPRPPGTALPQTSQDALLRELEGLLTGRAPMPVEKEPAGVPASGEVPDPDEARSLESLEGEVTPGWREGLERASEIQDTPRWAEGRDREAGSLETLEEAGEASHDRFHARYDVTAQSGPRARRAPTFDVSEVRRAVVWSEILGPPVSLR